jgi:glutamate-1-semialdehyde 2,1-aminomutase
MSQDQNSRSLFNRAAIKIPGGVNSPVRAWKAVGGLSRFIERGAGAYVFDADGNRYIDYVGSYGPAILGHAHAAVVKAVKDQAARGFSYGAPTKLEVELAEMISAAIPRAEKIRLLSSGTEAGMTAIRIARAATSRPGIIKFDGCYHGHSDSLLVRAGSGAMTLGVPDSAGVPEAIASATRVASWNDVDTVEKYFAADPHGIAAIIVETVAANMGVVLPSPDFLHHLGAIAHRYGAMLICDEVITGFRLRYGGAYELYGVEPNLIMLGKIIGGGLPIGAVAGRAELMDLLAPIGPVYQAGTLSGNQLSVRAGVETLKNLLSPAPYSFLERSSAYLEAGLREALEKSGVTGCINRVGSLLTLFLGVDQVRDALSARKADVNLFRKFFHAMLERGIYLPPSQFEAMFVSTAHTPEDLDATIAAATESLAKAGKA